MSFVKPYLFLRKTSWYKKNKKRKVKSSGGHTVAEEDKIGKWRLKEEKKKNKETKSKGDESNEIESSVILFVQNTKEDL